MDSGVTTSTRGMVEIRERLPEEGWEEGSTGRGEGLPEPQASSKVTSREDAEIGLDDGVETLEESADPVERYKEPYIGYAKP